MHFCLKVSEFILKVQTINIKVYYLSLLSFGYRPIYIIIILIFNLNKLKLYRLSNFLATY